MGLNPVRERKTFASVLGDGTVRVQCEKSDEGAVLREYELSDGTKGEKYEKVYESVSGKIKKIEFVDGKYGSMLNVEVDDITLSLNLESNFAEDFMKKLPGINLAADLTIAPYSFEDDKTSKNKRGVTIIQSDEKLKNFFYNGKDPIHGFPEIHMSESGGKWDKDDWKVYFIQVRKFLKGYTEENIIPKIGLIAGGQEVPAEEFEKAGEDVSAEDITIDDINTGEMKINGEVIPENLFPDETKLT